jgi:hypothetical protein
MHWVGDDILPVCDRDTQNLVCDTQETVYHDPGTQETVYSSLTAGALEAWLVCCAGMLCLDADHDGCCGRPGRV